MAIQDILISGEALETFGFVGENTISGIGLMTFGFIWNCGDIWSPTDDPSLTTTWTASTFGATTIVGCISD